MFKPSEFETIFANRSKKDYNHYEPTEEEINNYLENNEKTNFVNFGVEEDFYKNFYDEAYKDCLAVGIPVGKVVSVGCSDYDRQDRNASMMTMYKDINGTRYFKITILMIPTNEELEYNDDNIIQMGLAHELIHTACFDDRHGNKFDKYVKKIIRYGNKKYGGYDENPYNEMDLSYNLNEG